VWQRDLARGALAAARAGGGFGERCVVVELGDQVVELVHRRQHREAATQL